MTTQITTRRWGKERTWRVLATGATLLGLVVVLATGFRQETPSRHATSPAAAVVDAGVKTMAPSGRETTRVSLVVYLTESEEAATVLRSALERARHDLGGLGPPLATLVLVAGSPEAENLAGLPLPPRTVVTDRRAATVMGAGTVSDAQADLLARELDALTAEGRVAAAMAAEPGIDTALAHIVDLQPAAAPTIAASYLAACRVDTFAREC